MAEFSPDVKEQLARINETFGCLVDERPETEYPGTPSLFDRLARSDVKNIEYALPAPFGTEAEKMLAHWKVSNLPHYRREILRYGSAIAPKIIESKDGPINAVHPSDIHSMVRQVLKIACVEQVAYHMGYIDRERLLAPARHLGKSEYGRYLESLMQY